MKNRKVIQDMKKVLLPIFLSANICGPLVNPRISNAEEITLNFDSKQDLEYALYGRRLKIIFGPNEKKYLYYEPKTGVYELNNGLKIKGIDRNFTHNLLMFQRYLKAEQKFATIDAVLSPSHEVSNDGGRLSITKTKDVNNRTQHENPNHNKSNKDNSTPNRSYYYLFVNPTADTVVETKALEERIIPSTGVPKEKATKSRKDKSLTKTNANPTIYRNTPNTPNSRALRRNENYLINETFNKNSQVSNLDNLLTRISKKDYLIPRKRNIMLENDEFTLGLEQFDIPSTRLLKIPVPESQQRESLTPKKNNHMPYILGSLGIIIGVFIANKDSKNQDNSSNTSPPSPIH